MFAHQVIDAKFGQANFMKAKETSYGFELSLFFDLWCASLYAVVEGYERLGLEYPRTEKLLASPLLSKLRKYRHGTFHFNETYFDRDMLELAMVPGGIAWLREFQLTFGQEMAEEMKRRSALGS